MDCHKIKPKGISMKKSIMLSSLIFLTACGGVSQITPMQQSQVEQLLPAIDSAYGQICIFRASNYGGAAVSFEMRANGESIGRLSNSSYFCTNLSPDEYIITGESWTGYRVSAETIIRSGTRKYMELQVGMDNQLILQTRELGLAGIYGAM